MLPLWGRIAEMSASQILPLAGEVSAKPTEGDAPLSHCGLPPPALRATSPFRGRIYPRDLASMATPRSQQLQRPNRHAQRHDAKSTHHTPKRPHTSPRPATGEAVQLAT
jgi:hypothetical protein